LDKFREQAIWLEVRSSSQFNEDPKPALPRYGKFKPVLARFFGIPKIREGKTMKLYVGNLSFNTNNQDLNELFATIGTVESANVIEDRETGRSRGFGFVEMASQADGERAIAELDGKEVDGRALKVNEAKPQGDRNGGGRGGRGGFGGGGRGRGNSGGYGGRGW
jgi:hypothetical protein